MTVNQQASPRILLKLNSVSPNEKKLEEFLRRNKNCEVNKNLLRHYEGFHSISSKLARFSQTFPQWNNKTFSDSPQIFISILINYFLSLRFPSLTVCRVHVSQFPFLLPETWKVLILCNVFCVSQRSLGFHKIKIVLRWTQALHYCLLLLLCTKILKMKIHEASF